MDEIDEQNESMEVNSNTDSSDSDDNEQEQALINKAEELERQISANKYLYNTHEELVSLYRQLGDLTSMRLAYERFHEYFPLTPQLWLSWISDEKRLANSESEIKNVFSLFDKAVLDYLSVNLWVEYAQYCLGKSSLEETRQIIEKGLTAVGLHAAEGHLLWDTLREIELAHLSLTPEGTEQWKEQVAKIVEVFRRQLSVPLVDMENTYSEWKQFLEQLSKEQKINAEPVEWGYKKALKTLEIYKPFEQKLLETADATQLLETYREYIKVITDPSTIICVYERAGTQLCLNTNIWVDYCLYALKLGEPADMVSIKSLRNCPWSEELWVLRLRILEHLGREENEILTWFEQGISSLGASNCIELWLTYLEYVNRHSSDNKEKLYKSFDQALEQLQYQDEGFVKVTKWYAKILAKNGDMAGARRLWKNNILRNQQNKTLANVWLEYASLERQYGEPSHLRNLFQRALTTCTDWPQFIAEEWLMFERESGKLSDVMKCLEKRNEVIKNLPQEPEKTEDVRQKSMKRKLPEEIETEAKKSKINQIKSPGKKVLKDPTTTVFVSNLHKHCNEKKLRKMFPNALNIELVTDKKGNSRCYGYVQFSLEEEVGTALARDRELIDGRPIFISNCKPDRSERQSGFKFAVVPETNKLFIKGLPHEYTENDLEKLYKKHGCKAVRLVRRKDGQSKGLAYVEFDDDKSAQKAMKETDQMKIGEHTITVAISAPPPKTSAVPKVTTPVRNSKTKLSVPLIPRQLQVKSGAGNSNGEAKSNPPKSNDDFRKMFLK